MFCSRLRSQEQVVCEFAGCGTAWVGQGDRGSTEAAPLQATADLGSPAAPFGLGHKTLSCCFIFIVVSINEVSHQFCFTINHGQESGCCREGHSAQLCLAGAELASPFPACPSPGTSGTLIRDTLSCLVLLFSLSTLQGGPEVAKPQNAFLC